LTRAIILEENLGREDSLREEEMTMDEDGKMMGRMNAATVT